jgi:hypothetical protein
VTTVAFSGGTASAATIGMRVTQHYWAPVGKTLAGAPVEVAPPGAGDYLETRYETQTVSAVGEPCYGDEPWRSHQGHPHGVECGGYAYRYHCRVVVGTLLDNQPIDESVPVEEFLRLRPAFGRVSSVLT